MSLSPESLTMSLAYKVITLWNSQAKKEDSVLTKDQMVDINMFYRSLEKWEENIGQSRTTTTSRDEGKAQEQI